MIQFTCPGCANSHAADETFAGLRARCVVCGASIRIPKTSNAVAEVLAPLAGGASGRSQADRTRLTKPARKAAPKPVTQSLESLGDSEADMVFDDPFDQSPVNHPSMKADATSKKPGKTSSKKVATKSKLDREPNANDRVVLTDEIDELTEDTTDPTVAKQRRKQRLIIGAVLTVGLLVIGYVLFGSSGSDGTKPVAKSAPTIGATTLGATTPGDSTPPTPLPKKEVPALLKPEDMKGEKGGAHDPFALPPEVGIAPPPRVSINEPLPFTAARLLLEHSDDAAAFEGKYRGQRFLVQGTCLSAGGENLLLAETVRGNVGQEPRRIVCKLPRPREDEKSLAGVLVPTWPKLQPGQPVAVRGTYLGWVSGNDEPGSLQLGDCAIVQTTSPADSAYSGKELELTGIVRQFIPMTDESPVRFSTLVIEPPTTDSPITVRCLFRQADQDGLAKLQTGTPVAVRGICGGRSFGIVALHNCVLVTAQSPPATTKLIRVSAEQLFTAYEADLLPGERPSLETQPIPVSSVHIAERFALDPQQANAEYRFKFVEVTGRVIERLAESRTLVLETGTNHKLLLAVVFTPKQFAKLNLSELKPADPPFTLRGVCVGIGSVAVKKRIAGSEDEDSKAVRIENAFSLKEQTRDTVAEIVGEFFPTKTGHELTYDILTVNRPKDNPLLRLHVRCAEAERFVATPLRSGSWPAATLFAEQPLSPKWLRDLTKQKTTPQITQHRLTEGTIETRDVPAPPNQPSSWWDPVLKLGVKKGESWSSERPDGRIVTYTVESFASDALKRPVVEIRRVMKHPKEPAVWEESRIVYTLGVGETRRVVSTHSANGQAFTMMEMRLVDAATDAKEPEKKEPPVGPPKPSEKTSQPK